MFTFSSISRRICISEPINRVQKILVSYATHQHFIRFNAGSYFNHYIQKLLTKIDSFKTSGRIKDHTGKILRSWAQQVEFITAYRVRRSFQIISTYKRWWGNCNKFTFYQFSNGSCRKKLYFTACLVPLFDWDRKRIPQHELSNLLVELFKTKKTIVEKQGGYPLPLPEPRDSPFKCELSSCNCDRCQHLTDEGWNIFYESGELKIWRKEHMGHRGEGLYVYKVYGYYKDVIPDDYFRVQIDTTYRKEWDRNAVELQVVDSDSKSNSDVLYWEFLFPRMFYNRDYVCNRRYEINEEKQYMAIVSESIEHPLCPEKPPVYRVKEYWSHIVIRPTMGSFYEPGMEFTITYFDNPQLSIPSSISVWYTIQGMPEYLLQQKLAALYLSRLREAPSEEVIYTTIKSEETPNDNKSKESKEVQGRPHKRVLIY